MDYVQKKVVAGEKMARILMDVKCVKANLDEPYTFTSGTKSPLYIDIRRLISFVKERETATSLLQFMISEEIKEPIGALAGGETAGIPFAAFLSRDMGLPMLYVRKKAKGFGRNAQVEGYVKEGTHVVLVEDLMFDGGSKINFVEGLRDAGLIVKHVALFATYGLYEENEKSLGSIGVKFHNLTDWPSIIDIGEKTGYFSKEEAALGREFLKDPHGWSLAHGGK